MERKKQTIGEKRSEQIHAVAVKKFGDAPLAILWTNLNLLRDGFNLGAMGINSDTPSDEAESRIRQVVLAKIKPAAS